MGTTEDEKATEEGVAAGRITQLRLLGRSGRAARIGRGRAFVHLRETPHTIVAGAVATAVYPLRSGHSEGRTSDVRVGNLRLR